MKRRDFLSGITVGIGAASFARSAIASRKYQQLEADALRNVTLNIHAQFGDGFEVCAARLVNARETECVIAHRGNLLVVRSQDMALWTIQRATEM